MRKGALKSLRKTTTNRLPFSTSFCLFRAVTVWASPSTLARTTFFPLVFFFCSFHFLFSSRLSFYFHLIVLSCNARRSQEEKQRRKHNNNNDATTKSFRAALFRPRCCCHSAAFLRFCFFFVFLAFQFPSKSLSSKSLPITKHTATTELLHTHKTFEFCFIQHKAAAVWLF